MDNFLQQSQLIDEIIGNKNVSEIKKNYKEISSKYRGEKINSTAVVSGDRQALSYLSSRMGETSAIIYDVLSRLNNLVDLGDTIDTVLDLGSGTGSVFWALANFVDSANITAVEMQESMLKYSKMLSTHLNFDITYINANALSDKVKNLNNFDLVIESFMLNEMSTKDRLKALDLMCEKTDKYMILIEPGTPYSYEKMMQDRAYLLDKGMNLVLPCPHSFKCALKDDYCNFTVRVNRTKTSRMIKDASLNYEDEKYFYLIFSKDNVIDENKSIVIRKPVYRKGLVELKLCKPDSTINSTVVTKSNQQHYPIAKKINHGDHIDI